MATFVFLTESFDHTAPSQAAWKHGAQEGTYTLVAGPYLGAAARFSGEGNWIGGQGTQPFGFETFRTPGLACHLRLSGAGDVVIAQGVWRDPAHPTAGDERLVRQLVVVRDDGAVDVRFDTGGVIASSAPGLVPRPAVAGVEDWVHVEVGAQLEVEPPNGYLGIRVTIPPTSAGPGGMHETVVEDVATVLDNVPEDVDPRYIAYWRVGHLGSPPGSSGGEAVLVDVDDLLYSVFDPFYVPMRWHGPKIIACRFPDGPGSRTDFTVAGTTANWHANAESPPDEDVTRVVSPAGTTSPLPARPVPHHPRAPVPAGRGLPARGRRPGRARHERLVPGQEPRRGRLRHPGLRAVPLPAPRGRRRRERHLHGLLRLLPLLPGAHLRAQRQPHPGLPQQHGAGLGGAALRARGGPHRHAVRGRVRPPGRRRPGQDAGPVVAVTPARQE